MERIGMMSEYSESLKARRKSVSLTQQQLADLADVKLSMIADLESDRQRPNEATARLLDEVLKKAEAEFKHKTVKDIFVLARTEAGLSQEEVAKRAKVDPIAYAKWEGGIASLDDETIF